MNQVGQWTLLWSASFDIIKRVVAATYFVLHLRVCWQWKISKSSTIVMPSPFKMHHLLCAVFFSLLLLNITFHNLIRICEQLVGLSNRKETAQAWPIMYKPFLVYNKISSIHLYRGSPSIKIAFLPELLNFCL